MLEHLKLFCVRPHEYLIQSLGERDTLLSGEHLHELQLAYNFHVVSVIYILHTVFHTPFLFLYSIASYILVMGGNENFLSRLLKDKIPRYHGILPYSDFSIFY